MPNVGVWRSERPPTITSRAVEGGGKGKMRGVNLPPRNGKKNGHGINIGQQKRPTTQNSPPVSSCGAPIGWSKEEGRISFLAVMSIVGC